MIELKGVTKSFDSLQVLKGVDLKIAPREIVSIMGTISKDGVHIHISFADNTGKVVGGHLTEGCIINTTCEVSIIKSDKYKLSREYDEETCYKELVIEMN